jgi:CheY-like chemotaxis protein
VGINIQEDPMFRIMLVEDELTLRQLFKCHLEDQFPSVEITEASNAIEALKKIDFQPPHLIFMDSSLPGENGLELTRKIKEEHPEIMIVIVTGHDLPEYREEAKRCKADYFFSKGATTMYMLSDLVKSLLLKKGFNAHSFESLSREP